jgi:creatinine amidohydrolase/Fe(II)-dependent formamide hydrolase-like protein/ribosomal protein S18 acetylase RimI-like enzyme
MGNLSLGVWLAQLIFSFAILALHVRLQLILGEFHMIDANSTSPEWQVHTGDIIVLPVGSMEQHAAHMPLNTDSIGAEYTAGILAEHFDWALLPTIQIANCFEHSGFRGSFSLKPETLMCVIRDLAAEAENQNFRIMVIVNGHGGNFALGPVVRDINRMDGKLKIILIDSWEKTKTGVTDASKHGIFELHSGEFETSIQMYVAPETVRNMEPGIPPVQRNSTFSAPELNTFGLGCSFPHGNVGDYTLATPEKGREMIEGGREALFALLEERIERLRKQPLYSGAGGLAIRKIVTSDMSDLNSLVEQAGWNQLPRDWSNLMMLAPDTCFGMVRLGKVIGSATAVKYGKDLAWIGMVIVDDGMRRLGIASRLMNATIAASEDCATIKLDATPAGREVYKKLGFVDEYRLTRLTGTGRVSQEISDEISSLKQNDIDELISFDKNAFGVERGELLRQLISDTPELAFVARKNDAVIGFCLGRRGRNHTQIGPVVAIDSETALALVDAVSGKLAGESLAIDVLNDNEDFVYKLRESGFSAQRTLIRMYRGPNDYPGETNGYFAVAGYEFG